MLQVNVSQLLKEPIGATREVQVDDFTEVGGHQRHVTSGVRLTRTDRGVLARAVLRTAVELTCSRCLSQYSSPVDIVIEEVFHQTRDVNTGAALAAPDQPGEFVIDAHHDIDLSEAVRQYVALALPMKPLCREDCAGLCPKCGHSLNQGRCGCPTNDMDPRWAALARPAAANRGRA